MKRPQPLTVVPGDTPGPDGKPLSRFAAFVERVREGGSLDENFEMPSAAGEPGREHAPEGGRQAPHRCRCIHYAPGARCCMDPEAPEPREILELSLRVLDVAEIEQVGAVIATSAGVFLEHNDGEIEKVEPWGLKVA